MSDNINVAMEISDLPHDVLTQVFQMLDRHPTSLAKCCCTCRTWRTLASDDEIWREVTRKKYKYNSKKLPAGLPHLKQEYARRWQMDKEARAALGELVFPLQRQAALVRLEELGTDIKDVLKAELRLGGCDAIGRRHWAGVALARVETAISVANLRRLETRSREPRQEEDWVQDVNDCLEGALDVRRCLDGMSPTAAYKRLMNTQAAAIDYKGVQQDLRPSVRKAIDALGGRLRDLLNDVHPGSLQALTTACSVLFGTEASKLRTETAMARLHGPARFNGTPAELEALQNVNLPLDGNAAYYKPENSLLNRVLHTGMGIPLSLSVILAAVAASGGVRLHFVGAPGHFLTRFEVTEGPCSGETVWVDAFEKGKIMTREETLRFISHIPDVTNEASRASLLEDTPPQKVVGRMLINLLMLYARTFDNPPLLVSAAAVLRMLSALEPNDRTHAMNLGQVELALNNWQAALQAVQSLAPPLTAHEQSIVRAATHKQDAENSRYRSSAIQFRVGDIVRHKRYNYRAVIFGWDPKCAATHRWMEQMNIRSLPHGKNQPFYHTLCDQRDRPGSQTTYVAQENLELVEIDVEDNDEEVGCLWEFHIDHDEVGEHFDGIVEPGTHYIPNRYRASLYPQDLQRPAPTFWPG